MALSVIVLVGETKNWLPDIIEKAKKLKVGPGHDPTVDIAPMNSKEGLKRVNVYIESGSKDANLVLDGRGVKVPEFPKGNFIGPSIIDNVAPGMD